MEQITRKLKWHCSCQTHKNSQQTTIPGLKNVISYVKGMNSSQRPRSTKHLGTFSKASKYKKQNLM